MIKEKIEEYCRKNGKHVVDFPDEIHLSNGTYYNRLKTNEWTRTEIKMLQQVLQLSDYEVVMLIKE